MCRTRHALDGSGVSRLWINICHLQSHLQTFVGIDASIAFLFSPDVARTLQFIGGFFEDFLNVSVGEIGVGFEPEGNDTCHIGCRHRSALFVGIVEVFSVDGDFLGQQPIVFVEIGIALVVGTTNLCSRREDSGLFH